MIENVRQLHGKKDETKAKMRQYFHADNKSKPIEVYCSRLLLIFAFLIVSVFMILASLYLIVDHSTIFFFHIASAILVFPLGMLLKHYLVGETSLFQNVMRNNNIVPKFPNNSLINFISKNFENDEVIGRNASTAAWLLVGTQLLMIITDILDSVIV